MLNKLSLLGNFFSSSFGIASSFFSRISNRIGSFFSCTGSFFSCACCFFSSFFSSFFSYNSCVVSLFCTCRKSRNSESQAAGYSKHFAEVCFGSHLIYPLWMN